MVSAVGITGIIKLKVKPKADVRQTTEGFGEIRRTENRKIKLERLIKKLIEILENNVPGITKNQKNLKISQPQIDAILKWIETQPIAIEQRRHLNNYLSKLLQNGYQNLEWDCVSVPLILSIPRDKNLLIHHQLPKLEDVRQEIKIFNETLIKPTPFSINDNNIKSLWTWGQILVSAVLHGGLLNTKSLLAFLVEPHPKLYKKMVWVSLFGDNFPAWVKNEGPLRQWFIDPTTLLLVKNAKLNAINPIRFQSIDEVKEWAIKCLNVFFRKSSPLLGFQHTPITSLYQWIERYQLRAALILPPYLLNYACNREIATALSDNNFVRLFEGKYLFAIPPNELNEKYEPTHNSITKNRKLIPKQVFEMDKEIRGVLYREIDEKNDKASVIVPALNKIVEKYKQHVPESMEALTLWLKDKIGKKEIKQSSAYEYYSSISMPLFQHLDSNSLEATPNDHFISIYECILEAADASSTKQGLSQRLKQFHQYLVLNYKVSPVDFHTIDEDCYISSADANLITYHEYKEIFSKINTNISGRFSKAALCMLILGYRCGLRINEEMNLRFCDFQVNWSLSIEKIVKYPMTMLIQNHAYNTLKTVESRRILPLYLLVPEAELSILFRYLKEELALGKSDHKRFIFAEIPDNPKRHNRALVYAYLNPYLRSQTKDSRLRFHHLRHSFINNLMLHLLVSRERLNLLHSCDPFYESLKERLERDGNYQRSTLFQIAEWVGHSSPRTTFASYTHVLDFMLFDALYTHSYNHVKRDLKLDGVFCEDVDPATIIAHQLGLTKDQLKRQIRKQTTFIQFIAHRKPRIEDYKSYLKKNFVLDVKWSNAQLDLKTIENMQFHDWVLLINQKLSKRTFADIFSILNVAPIDSMVLDEEFYRVFKPIKGSRSKQSALTAPLELQKCMLENTPDKFIYFPTIPRGDEYEHSKTIYGNLKRLYKIKPAEVSKHLQMFIDNFNLNQKEIRFDRTESKGNIYNFIRFLNQIIPEEITIKLNENQYKDVSNYKSSLKLYVQYGKIQQSAYSYRFAMMIFYLEISLAKKTLN